MAEAERRKQALNFLNSGAQKRKPRRDEFTAYGQACLSMAEGILYLLASHDARVFAAAIPRDAAAVPGLPTDLLRKDLVFLLERYFYFLEERQESGLLVMDGSEKQADRKLVRRIEWYFIEWYFTETMTGRQRTQWIVPAPFFVESDMAYGIQVADLCVYCLNWAWRLHDMTESTRPEIKPYVELIEKSIWHGDGYREGHVFRTHGTVYVRDPYSAREVGDRHGAK